MEETMCERMCECERQRMCECACVCERVRVSMCEPWDEDYSFQFTARAPQLMASSLSSQGYKCCVSALEPQSAMHHATATTTRVKGRAVEARYTRHACAGPLRQNTAVETATGIVTRSLTTRVWQ